ncbi:hypothetical protein [Streptomyces griseorubiginosus]|uniref:hypothetical protein n=1 Tax=Streptomyces griseorubiginosus TaxID=67304 RepID=UPI000782B622|nr:hypothetical protein [Streptomyces griseorubiginosus]
MLVGAVDGEEGMDEHGQGDPTARRVGGFLPADGIDAVAAAIVSSSVHTLTMKSAVAVISCLVSLGKVSVAAATNVGMTDDELIQRIREHDAADELPPPAPPEAVAELETAVGHPMPRLLKRIYLEVADGGFGRWGEALSLTDMTYSFSDSSRLLEEYLGWRGTPNHPPSVVPLLTWGCAIWSLVDYSTPEGRMWAWDPNARCPHHGHALFPEDHTLAERLGGWLDGHSDFPKAPAGPYCTEC